MDWSIYIIHIRVYIQRERDAKLSDGPHKWRQDVYFYTHVNRFGNPYGEILVARLFCFMLMREWETPLHCCCNTIYTFLGRKILYFSIVCIVFFFFLCLCTICTPCVYGSKVFVSNRRSVKVHRIYVLYVCECVCKLAVYVT